MVRIKAEAGALPPAIPAVVVILLLVTPNLLHALDIPYSKSHGPPWAKIHPAFYVVVALLVVQAWRRHFCGRSTVELAGLTLAGTTLLAILVLALSSTSGSGGGELSALIVTFLLPALLVLVLCRSTPKTLETIPPVLTAIFVLNSSIAIIESRTGLRLLPFVAGDAILDFDRRPTALLGHPLTNATLTGGWVLVMTMHLFRTQFRALPTLACGLNLLALVAFGGRIALAVTMALVAVFVISCTLARLARGGGGREVLRLGAIALFVLAIAVVGWSTGLADLTIARFEDGRGSNETRLAALRMLGDLEGSYWWTGAPVPLRDALQVQFGSPHGIELSWVALIMTYGMPLAAALLAATILVLATLSRGRGLPGLLLFAYFLVVTFASLSIGSKSLIISQFILIIFCVPKINQSKKSSRSPVLQNKLPISSKVSFDPRGGN